MDKLKKRLLSTKSTTYAEITHAKFPYTPYIAEPSPIKPPKNRHPSNTNRTLNTPFERRQSNGKYKLNPLLANHTNESQTIIPKSYNNRDVEIKSRRLLKNKRNSLLSYRKPKLINSLKPTANGSKFNLSQKMDLNENKIDSLSTKAAVYDKSIRRKYTIAFPKPCISHSEMESLSELSRDGHTMVGNKLDSNLMQPLMEHPKKQKLINLINSIKTSKMKGNAFEIQFNCKKFSVPMIFKCNIKKIGLHKHRPMNNVNDENSPLKTCKKVLSTSVSYSKVSRTNTDRNCHMNTNEIYNALGVERSEEIKLLPKLKIEDSLLRIAEFKPKYILSSNSVEM